MVTNNSYLSAVTGLVTVIRCGTLRLSPVMTTLRIPEQTDSNPWLLHFSKHIVFTSPYGSRAFTMAVFGAKGGAQ